MSSKCKSLLVGLSVGVLYVVGVYLSGHSFERSPNNGMVYFLGLWLVGVILFISYLVFELFD